MCSREVPAERERDEPVVASSAARASAPGSAGSRSRTSARVVMRQVRRARRRTRAAARRALHPVAEPDVVAPALGANSAMSSEPPTRPLRVGIGIVSHEQPRRTPARCRRDSRRRRVSRGVGVDRARAPTPGRGSAPRARSRSARPRPQATTAARSTPDGVEHREHVVDRARRRSCGFAGSIGSDEPDAARVEADQPRERREPAVVARDVRLFVAARRSRS